MTLKIELDHVALGLPRVRDAEPFLEGVLGGKKAGGHEGVPFGFMQWVFDGGGRIEVIYPTGDDGFLHRFLAKGGPRVHHVTFKVSSLDELLERARALGYAIASEDRNDPYWQEAFLHPKQAQGIVIQLVEHHPRPDNFDPADEPAPAGAARVIGPRLVAKSAGAARRQWSELLDASESCAADGALVFAWPESPLAVTVDVDSHAEEGPRAIELRAPRPLDLSERALDGLGTRFVQRS